MRFSLKDREKTQFILYDHEKKKKLQNDGDLDAKISVATQQLVTVNLHLYEWVT